jgi:metal-responsive CopG/Arc/MetJ family transcriptional regulator
MAKHVKKLRINITITPDLLKRVDEVATRYERSWFINEACVEKLGREKDKK